MNSPAGRFTDMRKFKLLALTATFVVATAGLALAGDCDKSASAAKAKAKSECSSTATAQTASAKAEGSCASTASAKTAKAEGSCASTASAQTAKAEGGCSSTAAAAKTASAEGGCSSTAAVKTASAEGECASKANVAGAIKVKTERMPSGALAVHYIGKTPEAVAFLQASAEKGCSGFACELAKGMAADENCKVEMAKTERGVTMVVTSEQPEVLDGYAAQYAAVMAPAEGSSEE
jgi:hypothetical protein